MCAFKLNRTIPPYDFPPCSGMGAILHQIAECRTLLALPTAEWL